MEVRTVQKTKHDETKDEQQNNHESKKTEKVQNTVKAQGILVGHETRGSHTEHARNEKNSPSKHTRKDEPNGKQVKHIRQSHRDRKC